ncbi:alpha/beta fold hydrolase [Herpetosiphon sp. NSE202]|uniref:alpha/beta fold hydrolase n=1 Tax=Herpetosiphon sp. NSE202 TaxID=3351349 RepID=UPI003626395E
MQTISSQDGTRLAYDVYGSGPPLIYVTGATCFRSFPPIVSDAKALAKAFTVYNYDRRGRGDSTDTLPYSLERELEDLLALIEVAGGKAHVYGHSSGAVLALEAALHYPAKLDQVFLYDPAYVHDATEKAEYASLRAKIETMLAHGQHARAITSFLQGIGMPKIVGWLMRFMPGWKTMVALAPTLAYDLSLTADLPPFERASQCKIPVHVMAGAKSPAGIRSLSQALAAQIPNASYDQLVGQGHMVNTKHLLPLFMRYLTTAAAVGSPSA